MFMKPLTVPFAVGLKAIIKWDPFNCMLLQFPDECPQRTLKLLWLMLHGTSSSNMNVSWELSLPDGSKKIIFEDKDFMLGGIGTTKLKWEIIWQQTKSK